MQKKGKLVYIDGKGNMKIVMEGVSKDIASIRVVYKKSIAEVLQRYGYKGSSAEVNTLLKGGLKEALDMGTGSTYELICTAIENASDKFTYVDPVKAILARNGCQEITCGECISCDDGPTCFHYGGWVNVHELTDCDHYYNDERLVLGKDGENASTLELPFWIRAEEKAVNLDEIIEAAKHYIPKDMEKFLEEAEYDSATVTLNTLCRDRGRQRPLAKKKF